MATITPLPEAAEPSAAQNQAAGNRALGILLDDPRAGRPVHVEHIPARTGREVPWPAWVPAEITGAFASRGIRSPWSHQAEAACHAQAGRNVIISTGAASGKSLGYLLPALTAVLAGETVLYVTPTKALAADQLASIRALGLPGIQAATFDGDTPRNERDWARSHARYLLTTPDMLHQSLLPRHNRWSGFLSRLRYVIIDECHEYRGVFGSHVGHVLRRLRRVVAHHALRTPGAGGPARPVFVLASATVGAPGACARLLTGLDAEAVTEDGSPRGPLAFALWEPPLTEGRGEVGARLRRTATAQTADLLARLVRQDVPTLAFIRSRRGAETVALAARRSLGGHEAPEAKVAAYRSGYLPEDRRDLEAAISDGRLVGLAATTALELGVNITGLDAVLIAGWPGSWASLWQQAGRAGRSGRSAAAVLIARDDPLDTYLVQHPEILLRHPVEATVLDPGNPYVLAPHLCAAAAELALTDADLEIFGPQARQVVEDLTTAGRLRRRPAGWYSMRRGVTAPGGLRGAGDAPVLVVEEATGRLVGTVDEPSAQIMVHDGAVYLHQGDSYLVSLARPGRPGGAGRAGRSRLHHHRPGRDRGRGPRRAAPHDLGPGRGRVRRRPGHQAGDRLHQAPLRHRRTARGRAAGLAAPPAADQGRLVDDLGCRTGPAGGRGHRPGRGRARVRARQHRLAAAVRHLRPLGYRRRVRRPAPGHRQAHGVRLRRVRRRGGLRRARFPGRPGLAHRDPAGYRRV